MGISVYVGYIYIYIYQELIGVRNQPTNKHSWGASANMPGKVVIGPR